MEQDTARNAKQEKAKTEDLHKFMDAPLTRAVSSSIPGCGGETFNLLISAAFDAGFECGQMEIVGEVTDMLLDSIRRDSKMRRSQGGNL